MRRVYLGPIVAAMAAALGIGLWWFLAQGNDGSSDADATLARLSKLGEGQTYYVRYAGANANDPNSLVPITFYFKPGVGFRVDLASPLDATDDAKNDSDLLKSGDIFIINPALRQPYASCRTARQTCRAADGLEVLGMESLLALFRYDTPFFDQPHTVSRTSDISAVGETARCFVISQRPTANENEQATAERSGFVPGAGLPKTFCYTDDGIPLGGLVSDTPPNSSWIKAAELKREVDDAAFDLPFPMVPSTYDRTPTARPSATLQSR